MAEALAFLSAHRAGVLLLIVVGFSLVAIVQWFAWIFGWGRFNRTNAPAGRTPQTTALRYVAANFFVEIINDFRHLLALLVVSVFALALAAAAAPGLRNWNVEQIGEGIEGVAAALGGLIGSIIGYYFGESAASQRRELRAERPGPIVQVPPAGVPPDAGITQAPPPPAERTQDAGNQEG